MRALLFCHNADHAAHYRDYFAAHGVTCDLFQQAADLSQPPVIDRAYGFLLVDLPTLVRAPQETRQEIHQLDEVLPTARVRLAQPGDELCISFAAIGCKSLEEFLAICRIRGERRLRRHRRYDIHLSVVVDDVDGTHHELTTTLNLSQGGGFILSANPYEVGTWLRLTFPEGALHLPPLEAVVRWHLPWGSHGRIPGIGVEFLEPPDNLISSIRAHLQRPRS